MKYTNEAFDGDNELLAGVNGMRSPVHITLDPSKVTAGADGRKTLAPGFWVAQSGDYGRPLPRAKIKTAVTTAATMIEVDNAQAFVAGDVLRIVPSSAQINITGTWAATNTLEVVIAGASLTYTATGADKDAIATAVAAAINSTAGFSGLATAIASGTSVYVLAKDYTSVYSISVTATGGTAAASIANAQSVLLPLRLLGAIDTDGVNIATNQLTLTGTAAVAVPVGMAVGTVDQPIGFHLRSLDLKEQALEVGLYTSLSLKKGALPYWDEALAKMFPGIQVVGK
jgi:hypothetical protein